MFRKDKLCKECNKKKDGMNWRNFPYIPAHLVHKDDKSVWHYYSDMEQVTYCRKPLES